MKKRLIAFLLVFTMMISSVGDVFQSRPGYALAENGGEIRDMTESGADAPEGDEDAVPVSGAVDARLNEVAEIKPDPSGTNGTPSITEPEIEQATDKTEAVAAAEPKAEQAPDETEAVAAAEPKAEQATDETEAVAAAEPKAEQATDETEAVAAAEPEAEQATDETEAVAAAEPKVEQATDETEAMAAAKPEIAEASDQPEMAVEAAPETDDKESEEADHPEAESEAGRAPEPEAVVVEAKEVDGSEAESEPGDAPEAVSQTEAEPSVTDPTEYETEADVRREESEALPAEEPEVHAVDAEDAEIASDVTAEFSVSETVDNSEAEGEAETVSIQTAQEGMAQLEAAGVAPVLAGAKPILQDMVDHAMAARETLSGKIQLVLSRSVRYEGDVVMSAGNRDVEEDFELELTAEDAGEDGMQGDGYTSILGNLVIRGIKIVLNSINLAAGTTVSVLNAGPEAKPEDVNRGGELVFNGTQNRVNALTLDVGKNSGAEINLPASSDTVQVTMETGAKSVTVNAGDGTNTVAANVAGGDFTVTGGSGVDTFSVTADGSAGKIIIDSGTNTDAITLVDNGGQGAIEVNAGADDDAVTIDVRASAADVNVDTGTGTDILNFVKGDHHTAENLDYSRVYNKTEKINDAATAVVTVINGDPVAADQATVDIATADAIKGIVFKDGAGVSVYLKGTLAKPEDGSNPIRFKEGDPDTILLTNDTNGEHKNTLEITGNANTNYTDALKNKKKVFLYADGDTYTYDGAKDNFTDYVFKTPVNGLKSITVTGSEMPLVLSNVVLGADDSRDEEDSIQVHDLSAANLNVLLKGRVIDIHGSVSAQNVRAESVHGTETLMQTINAAIGLDNADQSADLFNLSDQSIINVHAGAEVSAVRDIQLLNRVKHFGGLSTALSKIPGASMALNIVNLKMADAIVNIRDGAILTAGRGVTADAKIETVTGYNLQYAEDGSTTETESGSMPLAVSIVVNDAEVNVEKGAEVTAGNNILLNADSQVKVKTLAGSAFVPSLFDIGVTIISNKAAVLAGGKMTAGNEVLMNAVGSVTDVTRAAENRDVLPIGGFVAVNVVDQDVRAVVENGAEIHAGGPMNFYATATADVETSAVASSAAQDNGGMFPGAAFRQLLKSVVGMMKDSWKDYRQEGPDEAEKKRLDKLDKLLTKVAGSGYSVKLIGYSEENDEKGTASVRTRISTRKKEKGETASKVVGYVEIQPKENVKVREVRFRYLVPNESRYTYGTAALDEDASTAEKRVYVFDLPQADAEVYVLYDSVSAGDAGTLTEDGDEEYEDVYDLSALFDEASGAAEEETAEYLADKAEGTRYKLTFGDQSADGKVLTWKTATEKGQEGYSLSEIHAGEKMRFVGNPAQEGEKLISLKFSWTTEKESVEITDSRTVTADEAGRFYFTAPDDLPEDTEITVSAEFGKEEAAESVRSWQATGSIAAEVVLNDAHALIESGTTVDAGMITGISSKTTSASTLADASAVESGSGKKAEGTKETQLTKTEYSVTGAWYAVQTNSTKAGAVTGTMAAEEGSSALHPKFVILKEYADQMDRILLSYYTTLNASLFNGRRITEEIDPAGLPTDGEGNLIYQPELNARPVVYGSTLEVSFIFAEDGQPVDSGTTETQSYVVRNPISLRYNKLFRETEGSGEEVSVGTLTFSTHPAEEPGNYYFYVTPEKGYKIDSKKQGSPLSNTDALSASWRALDGTVQKAPLYYVSDDPITGGQLWYLKLDDPNAAIPEGTPVSVNALFTADHRRVTEKKEEHGQIAFDREEAKAGDRITATLTADSGYYAGGVELTYLDKTGETQTQTISGVDENNGVSFEMPEVRRGAQLFVRPILVQKTVELSVSGASKDGSSVPVTSVVLSEKDKGYDGETITVSPSSDLAKQGYKVSEIIYTPDGGTGVTVEGGSFAVPEGASSVSLLVNMTLKEFELSGSEDPDGLGSIRPEYSRADKNEKVFVNIVPKDGYRVKADTLKARIGGGSGSFQLVLRREGENRYSFTVPGENLDENTKIEVTGEFEKGSDALTVSAGVAVAVSVVQGNNENAIRGGDIRSEGDVNLSALTSGTRAETVAKGGFSQGKTGIAGAVAVQVASVRTRAATEADGAGSLTIRNGTLMHEALSIGKAEFTVSADAAGKKKSSAENTGVGAGIAVGVNALTTEAEAADGLILGKGTNLTGISLTASQKTMDTVSARAGAAGGSAAFVPAAAVDVFEGRAVSRLGSLEGVNGHLNVADQIRIIAASESAFQAYNHQVSADASTQGGSVALAGAFAVSWLSNRAEATMNRSVNAGNIALSARAADALKETAIAAASGGDKGKKDKNGGSSDKQANSLMNGAAGLAGRNGMDGGKIRQDAANRQKAETAEGSVAGSGAFVLNIMRNRSQAVIPDGVDVTAREGISVISANRTDATVKADGSTVRSDVGIGVAASVNIVEMDNIARIGNGKITANRVTVSATVPKAPPVIRPRTVAENASNFKTQLGETLRDGITQWLGDDYEWAAELIGDDFIASFADSLVLDLGMEKLFNISVDSIGDTFAKVIEKLQKYPATLIEPYRQLIAETLDTTEGLDEDKVLWILEDMAMEAYAQLTTQALTIIKDTVLESAKDMSSVFLLALSDGLGGKGWNAGLIKEQFKTAVVSKIKSAFMDKMVTDLVSKLGAKIPLINQHNAEVLKALKEKTGEELNNTFVESLTGTFRQEIYDYEILVTKIKENGIAKFLGDSLKNAAKKAASAVTNALIEKLVGKLNVKFSPEPVSDRHIVTTQSIAGAGAKDVGIAGSVSVAVADLNTEAGIASGAGAVQVKNDGGLTVNAEELRRIRTHATAAADAGGEADNHLGAGEAEDAGGGAEAGPTETNDGISVSTDGRGSASFVVDEDEPEFGDTLVRLYPDEGYTLKEGAAFVRRYTDEDDGEEITDSVTVHKDEHGYYIKPLEGIEDATERYYKLTAHVQAEFEKVKQEDAPEEDYGADGTSVGVGGAFALSYGSSSVVSSIGERESVTAGTIAVSAAASHQEENYATAGTDPLAGSKAADGNGGVQDYGMDASVSLNMMDNAVTAAIDGKTKVSATKKPSGEAEEERSEDEEIRREQVTDGALIVTAFENGEGETKASAFAAGDRTSVGASAAVNLSASRIDARLDAGAAAEGKAVVRADSHSEDNTWSFASAMGGDIQRMLDKVAGGVKATEETAGSLARGEYFDSKALAEDGRETTETGRRIAERMNGGKAAEGDEASADLSVSTNALRTRNAAQDSGREAGDVSKGAEKDIADNTDTELTGSSQPAETRKLQVAAAVGVTVSDHRAAVTVGGPVAAGQGVQLSARNTVNYNTRSTGAAMTLAAGNSIAAAVGVSVNRGQATVDAAGSLEAGDNVEVTATLTQNMDDPYTGKLGVQSLSGAVTGKDSTLAIAGAVSVLSTEAVTRAKVEGAEKITGNRVKISADDKSKNALRAGGVSVSKGAAVGMGLSAAAILSENTVEARLGDGVTVTANDFELSALKRKVTFDDYKFPLGWQDLVSDTSSLTDEQRENVYAGLIDVHRKPGETAYTVDVNLNTYALMKIADMLNFLSSNNYYAEAVAGSVTAGSSSLSGAGSAAIVKTANRVNAALGKNVTIRQSGWGGTSILADGSTSARIIGGAASLGSAKMGVGLTVTYLDHEDTVTAQTGEGLNAEAEGYTQQALADTTAQTFNAAAAVNTGEANLAAGGAVNVLLLKNSAVNSLGDQNAVSARGSLVLSSGAEMSLLNVSVGVAGAGKSTAAGGTVAYIRDEAASETNIGDGHRLTAGDHATITAGTVDRMISILASASAVPSGSGNAGAGAINVLDSRASGIVNLKGDSGSITARDGNLTILGEARSKAVNVTAAAAGAGGAAIGASANVNVFSRVSQVNIDGANHVLTAGRDVKVNALGEDTSVFGGLAAAGSTNSAAASGNVIVLAESSSIRTRIADAAQFIAGNAVQLESFLDETTIVAGGSIAVTGGALAIGETVLAAVQNNDVRTMAGASRILALGDTASETLAGDQAAGIYIGAGATETQFLAAAGVAVSTDASLNGLTAVLVNNNTLLADASRMITGRDDPSSAKEERSSTITVRAADDTRQVLIAGGVDVSGTAGAGASVVTLVSNKDIRALAGDLNAKKDISVFAGNRDDVIMLAVSAGVGGTAAVQIGAAVQVLSTDVLAEAGGRIDSWDGKLSIDADNHTKLTNAAAAVGLAGEAAVTPVGVVTVFEGDTAAALKAGAAVQAAKGVRIRANADKEADLYAVGAAAGGAAALSGTANVLISRDRTKAAMEKGAGITSSAGGLDVEASGDYRLNAVSAAVGAAGAADVAVNAVVSILKSSITSEMAGKASVAENVQVASSGARSVASFALDEAVAGMAGVGVNVQVLSAGTKMSQDAADMLTSGNSDSRDSGAAFSAAGFLSTGGLAQKRTEYERDENGDFVTDGDGNRKRRETANFDASAISGDLEGNGHRESEEGVGSSSGSGGDRKGTFDAASGYRSEDFDSAGYDDRGSTQRGENLEAKDTDDVAGARKLNTYTYTDEPEEAVIARITEDAEIEKAMDVTVSAVQPVMADLMGVTAAGGTVGAGVSVAVAILRSQVLAASSGVIREASGSVTIQADSVSDGTVSDQSEGLKKALNGLNPVRGGIRTIGAAMGVGVVGAAVAVSVALTDNITQAVLGGSVKAKGDVSLNAVQDYGHVVAATGALSGGAVAVGASVSTAQTEGILTARINDGAKVTAGENLQVKTHSSVSGEAVAATAGAGLAAVNAGVAIAVNRLEQNTGIRTGAEIHAQNMNIRADSDTAADSKLLGVSVGGAAVAMGAAVSQVNAVLNTLAENAALDAAGDIRVTNRANSTANPLLWSVSEGGAAVGGNVLLALNETTSKAGVSGSTVKAGLLYVDAGLTGKATSDLSAVEAGLLAKGISVNLADIRADNRAAVEDSEIDVARLCVRTGIADRNDTSAYARTISAEAGAAADGINTAIARNNTKNYAVLTGNRNVTADSVIYVQSDSASKADAEIIGLEMGALVTAVGTAVAVNDADSRAQVNLKSLNSDRVNFDVNHNAAAHADMLTGGGALAVARADAAAAYGRSTALVDASVGTLKAREVNAVNTAVSAAETTAANADFGGIAAGIILGVAYSQDEFDTRLSLGDGSEISGDVKVTTDYDLSAKADVTPSAGGVDVSGLEIKINLASARSTAHAGANLKADGGTVRAKRITVQTNGSGTANAIVRPAKVTVTGAKVGAGYANADLAMTQDAGITLQNAALEASGDVNVKSLARKADAIAEIGNAGVSDKGISISLLSDEISQATARERLVSRTGITGSRSGQEINSALKAASLIMKTEMDTVDGTDMTSTASASSGGAKDIALFTLGNLKSESVTADHFSALLKDVTVNTDGDTAINAITRAQSLSRGGVPGGYSAVGGGSSETNAYIGSQDNNQTAQVEIGDDVTVKAGGWNVAVARSITGTEAKMDRGTSWSLGSVNTSTQFTNTWVDTKVNIGKNAALSAGDRLTLQAESLMDSKSVVKSSDTGLVLNCAKMIGHNELQENIGVRIGENTGLTSGGDLKVNALSTATMDAESKYDGSFSLIGGTTTDAINRYNRNMGIALSDGVKMDSGKALLLETRLGLDDYIFTRADEDPEALLADSKSHAYTEFNGQNEISMSAVNLASKDNLTVQALTGGYFKTEATEDTGAFEVDGVSKAENVLTFNNMVNINKGQLDSGKKSSITSKDGAVDISAMFQKLHPYTRTYTEGSAAIVSAYATSINYPQINTIIELNNTDFSAADGVRLVSSLSKEMGNDGTFFEEYADAHSYTPAGYEYAEAVLQGIIHAWILSDDTSSVTVSGGGFDHTASGGLKNSYNADCSGLAPFYDRVDEQRYRSLEFCDFCKQQTEPERNPSANAAEALAPAISKALAPALNIRKLLDDGEMLKNGIFDLDRIRLLTEDLILTEEELQKYVLWTNGLTHQDYILLHNASRLYRGAQTDYIAETFTGSIQPEDDVLSHIVILTALNRDAFRNPVIPVGSMGSLDFRTGSFTMPASSRFDLYLYEISGAWLTGRMNDGTLRMTADAPEEISGFIGENGELKIEPMRRGIIPEGLTEDSAVGGWRRFWLGYTPETVPAEDEPLIFLLWNERTDEIRAFRTSAADMAADAAPVAVSLHIWCGVAERIGEETYRVVFFDTPAGEKSRVTVINHVLSGHEPIVQHPLQIALRGRSMNGTELPVYSLSGYSFIMNDGTGGEISLFDGEYTASFDGDVFESDYIRVEGIRDSDLVITIKKNQYVWCETDEVSLWAESADSRPRPGQPRYASAAVE